MKLEEVLEYAEKVKLFCETNNFEYEFAQTRDICDITFEAIYELSLYIYKDESEFYYINQLFKDIFNDELTIEYDGDGILIFEHSINYFQETENQLTKINFFDDYERFIEEN